MIKSLSQKIIDAFLEHGNLTDRDLVKLVKADGSSVRPRRLNLQRKGIIIYTGNKDFTKSKIGRFELGSILWGASNNISGSFFSKKEKKYLNL